MGLVEILAFPIRVIYLWVAAILKAILPRKKKSISGQVVFMTGAGSGIGRCMSYKFAEYGATIVCTDINKQSAEETAENIKAKGGDAFSYKLDVTNREEVYHIAKLVQREIGDVDILVNNAGIVTGKKLMDCPDELIVKTMEVNTISHFWTLKAFLAPMLARNRGHIVSIASMAGYFGSPKLIDYTASKFGAVGIMEALTMELWTESDGVHTTTVCPYYITTGMFDGVKKVNPFMPLLDPEYVAKEVVHGVLNNENVLFIPNFTFSIFLVLKSMLPLSVVRSLGELLSLEKQMDTFIGRMNNNKKSK